MDYTIVAIAAMFLAVISMVASVATIVLTKKTQERDNQRIEAENQQRNEGSQ
jgi:hypothetical protein